VLCQPGAEVSCHDPVDAAKQPYSISLARRAQGYLLPFYQQTKLTSDSNLSQRQRQHPKHIYRSVRHNRHPKSLWLNTTDKANNQPLWSRTTVINNGVQLVR
jgi:hypothetical protein